MDEFAQQKPQQQSYFSPEVQAQFAPSKEDPGIFDTAKGVGQAINLFSRSTLSDIADLVENAVTAGSSIVGSTAGALGGLATMSAPKRDASGAYIEGTGRGLDYVDDSIEAGANALTLTKPILQDAPRPGAVRNMEVAGEAMDRVGNTLLPAREWLEKTATDMGIPIEVAAAIYAGGVAAAELINPTHVPKGVLTKFSKVAQMHKRQIGALKPTGDVPDSVPVRTLNVPDNFSQDTKNVVKYIEQQANDIGDLEHQDAINLMSEIEDRMYDLNENIGTKAAKKESEWLLNTVYRDLENIGDDFVESYKQPELPQSKVPVSERPSVTSKGPPMDRTEVIPANRQVFRSQYAASGFIDEFGNEIPRGSVTQAELDVVDAYDNWAMDRIGRADAKQVLADDAKYVADNALADQEFAVKALQQDPRAQGAAAVGADKRGVKSPGDGQRGSVRTMDDDTRGVNALETAGGRSTADTDFVAFQADAPYSTRFKTRKAFDDWKKSTSDSDPEKRNIMYEVLDEQRQKIRSGATERDGRPYGAPLGGTVESRAALVEEYAARMERGLDAGIEPGYFYEEGRGTVQRVAPDAPTQNELSKQIEITSTQTGPAGNVDHTVRGRDQRAVGAQTNAGMYPNNMRPDFNQVSEGVDIFTGYKRDRYGNLLTPEGARSSQIHESALMPPNDRWEFKAAGFKGVPSDPKNVAYMDQFREDAVEIVNAKRRANNGQELTLEQGQEVHWAVMRAESEGRPLKINAGNDTIGGAFDRNAYSHTYEAKPGSNANHYQGATDEYDNALLDVRNEGGRDPLVSSMGGGLQSEVKPHMGYYIDDKGAGNFAPGQTSTSYVSRTDEGGINVASDARVNATDAIGNYANAQDAYAGNVFTPAGAGKNPKFNGVTIEGKASKEDMIDAVELAQEINPDIIVVNTKEGGLRAWFPGDYSTAAKKQIREWTESLKMEGNAAFGKVESNFNEFDWNGGNATQDVLDIIDNVDVSEVNALNQMAGNPNVGTERWDIATSNIRRNANSPETRAVLGKIADKYEELRSAGFGVPNEKLIAVLRTWADEGLPAVRKMVRDGLAPAGVLAILAGQDQEPSQNALLGET